MIKLHNTLTRQVEEFKPIIEKHVSLYTCGPTVYDHLTLGNWVSYIRWDTLVRTLKLTGYDVNRVMNITDVGHLVSDADEGEDKLEKGAKREGKSAWEVANQYTDTFHDGMEQLNLLPPTIYAKATEHIPEQIELIKKLEEKGYTYTISDGVYFDTAKFPTYADFAHLELDDQKEGARVEANHEKRNPSDFALWKFSPKDHHRDMEWESPWGIGFPGWHLECSAMAMKYLGETIDIHTGGIDHIPVHHTNEIAQSEAATGKRFVNYWLHNNFLLIDSTKISKSLNNGITLEQLQEHGFSPLDFKLFVLQSHYRTESNFTWENLQAAQNRLKDLQAWADLRYQPSADSMPDDLDELFRDTRQKMLEAVQDDLNTPLALSALSKLVTHMHNIPIPGVEGKYTDGTLKLIDDLFGLNLSQRPDITSAQKELISNRETARKDQDWQKSDDLRGKLIEQGIEINDTQHGPIWYRS